MSLCWTAIRTGIILLSCVGLLSSFSAGQQQTESLSDATLDELVKVKVYSASKHLQDQSDAPAHVTVVTADEIQKHGYRTLADILQSVGGFYITYDRGYSYIGVRGFSRPGDYNSRILLLVDGHRLNEALYDMAMVGTEMPLNVDLIERVEIIRGPGSSLYGTSAFFAVINVVTRKVRDYRGLEVSADGGSFGTAGGRITEGGVFKGIDVLLSGSVYSSSGQTLFYPQFDSPANNNGITRGTDYDRSQNFFGNISYRNWTLEALYGRREKGDPTAAYGTIFGDSQNRTLDARGFLDLGYTTKVKGWDLAAHASYDRYVYDGYYDYASQDQSGSVLNRDVYSGSWWGSEAEISRTVLSRHKLTFGFEFRDNYRESLVNFDVQPFTLYSNVNHDSVSIAGFVQDEITISKRVVLNVGARHDHYSTFGESDNPRVALIVHPRASTTLKLVYGTAFRAPNVGEQYNGLTLDPNLRPERIRTIQGIVEQALGTRTHFTVTGYQNRISSLISYTVPDAQGFVFHNDPSVQAWGGEADVDHQFESGVQARVSYAYTQVNDRQDSADVANSPHHVIKAAVSVPLYRQVLFSSLDASYISRRENLSEATTGGEARVNLTLYSHEFHNGLSLSASAYNLLDKKYYDPGFEWHAQDAILQDGRSLRVKVTYNFRRAQ